MPKQLPWSTATVVGAALFAVLLLLLHALKPELDPSWHFISEYALGRHGWVMTLAFVVWGASFLAAAIGVRTTCRGILSWVAAGLLVTSGLSAILAAAFPTDPLQLSGHVQPTSSGAVHNAAGALGIVMPIAVGVTTFILLRHTPWRAVRVPLGAAAALAILGFVGSFGTLALLLNASGGRFGPDVPIGWPNRLEVFGYSVWLMVLGWSAQQVAEREAPSTSS